METKTVTSQESATAGKAGEPTAQREAAASRSIDPKNLTPEGVTSLLTSEFALPPATPAVAGEEVQPATPPGGDETPPADPPETETTENPTPSATPEGELPAAVLQQVEAWEQTGGALPAPLQAILDKRISREVGKVKDLEHRATTAEAEVTRLTGELETRSASRTTGNMDEKSLQKLVDASKKFQADARAFLGGYADEDQSKRLEAHMQSAGQDEKALRRQLDEVNDWLTEEVPQVRERIKSFRAQELQVEAAAKQFFPFLDDKTSPDYLKAQEVIQLFPEVKQRTPAWKLALGIYTLGFKEFEKLQAAAKAKTNGNGAKPGVLPGKAPVKSPTGGSPAAARIANPRAAEEEQASQSLRENPSAENVTNALRMALR